MRTRSLLLACALVAVALPAFSAPTVAGLVEKYGALHLGDAFTVQNLPLKSGHLDVTLASGTLAKVMAGDETVGLFFNGRGTYAYTSAEPVEQPLLETNLRRATKLASEKSGDGRKVSDEFQQLFVWWLGSPLPDVAGTPAAASIEKEFKEHRELFLREWGAPAVHRAVQRQLNPYASKFIRFEIAGGKETAAYEWDEAEDFVEVFYTLERAGGTHRDIRNRLTQVPLSEQPIGRTAKQPPAPPFLLTDVDYTLVASESNEAALTVTETFTAGVNGVAALRLDLYSDRMDDKRNQRHYKVRSVKDASGKELSFDHREDSILFGLSAPLRQNATAKVTFEIEGDFLIRPQGDNFWQLGVEPWFPMPDLNGQYYTLHSVVKVKKPYVPLAPGKTIRRVEEGDYNVVENRIEKPVQFAVALAGKYSYDEETKDGVTVRVATYGQRNNRAIKQLTELAFGIIDFYEYFLGPFPFPELNIIQIDAYGFGQAPPGTMFITNEAFNPTGGDIMNQLYSKGINERFAHEIAHQYWGHAVKMPSGEEQWLTESFAEYSAALFIKKLKGKAMYEQMLREWESRSKDATKSAPIPMANRIRIPGDQMANVRERTALVYFKGALLLADLHQELGDQVFLSFMKSYQKSFLFKFGTSNDVAGLLEFITKKDYRPYMDRYFWGTEMPEVR
ncbi:MAG TPA: M1 family aminopeptidase [Thermoanaerobaculia bacterium]